MRVYLPTTVILALGQPPSCVPHQLGAHLVKIEVLDADNLLGTEQILVLAGKLSCVLGWICEVILVACVVTVWVPTYLADVAGMRG